MSDPLRWVLATVVRTDARGRLAERVAHHLRQSLPEDHIVLAAYAPRDRGERIPIVVVGRLSLFVIEPRDEDGDLACYQDHWYRRVGRGRTHALAGSPSVRAQRNAGRVRNDLGTGGFMNVPIEPVVLLTRGRPDDVGSSCVPVVAGADALARYMLRGLSELPDAERTRALAAALAKNIQLSIV